MTPTTDMGNPEHPGVQTPELLTQSPKEHRALHQETGHIEEAERFQHSWRIIVIALVLAILTFVSGIDGTIIATSLPTITREISGAREYVWVAQSYLFACTVPQPFYGQVANIFGRRGPLLVSVALFALGSGIAGGARNVATLIAGRIVQGLGTAGINVLPEIIVCDLVPPRQRGAYLSAMLSTAAIGSTIGPVIGGALAQADWRWIFWLNLPISAVGAIALFLLLNAEHSQNHRLQGTLARLDSLGIAIFVPSMVSLFFGLIMGGTDGYPWSSWKVILPLVLGVVGWIVFHIHQGSRFCQEPSVPPRLFKNRTSFSSFIVMFLASVVIQALSYFLPIYFQALKGVSPLTSGVYFLPFALGLLPSGAVAATILSKTGQYKPLHWAGFAMLAIGSGLFSTLDEGSGRGEWIGYQLIAAFGAGFIFTVALPSTLAELPEKDVATATSTFAFIRAFGLVWGATISSIIFNGQVNSNLGRIEDLTVRARLENGAAYTFASGNENGESLINHLDEPTKSQVIHLYEKALSIVWLVFVGIAGVGFVAAFFMRQVALRKHHEKDGGLSIGSEAAGETSNESEK